MSVFLASWLTEQLRVGCVTVSAFARAFNTLLKQQPNAIDDRVCLRCLGSDWHGSVFCVWPPDLLSSPLSMERAPSTSAAAPALHVVDS